MLRGNHECPMINRVYGFLDEINRRYRNPRLWHAFQETFNWMPLAGLVGGRILCKFLVIFDYLKFKFR